MEVLVVEVATRFGGWEERGCFGEWSGSGDGAISRDGFFGDRVDG